MSFQLFVMPCCGHALYWVNPRLPTYCPECGEGVYRRLRSGEHTTVLDERAQRMTQYGYRSGYIEFSDSMPLPASIARRSALTVCQVSLDEYEQFAADEERLRSELDELLQQVSAALRSYTTVEKLAEGWPEAYEHFPKDDAPRPGTLPAVRIEDLNMRLAAARAA